MKNTILVIFSVATLGCQPQQTDIFTEIRSPDGTITKYVNKSNGFGYNPNATSNLNVGGIRGADNVNINSGYGYGGYGYGGWGYGGYGGYGGWGYGGFAYTPGCVTTPGAMPIPQNLNVYNYNPAIR